VILNNDAGDAVSVADRVTPPYVAEIVATPDAVDAMKTGKAPVELSRGIVTVAGTVATEVLLLDIVTSRSTAGLVPVKKRVAEDCVVPVCTRAGLTRTESSVSVPEGGSAGDGEGEGGGGGGGNGEGDGEGCGEGCGGGGVATVQPDRTTLTAVADPSLTSTLQSAGAAKPERSILKLPVLLLVVIETPSTVIARPAVA
jgi:hypothetical protein